MYAKKTQQSSVEYGVTNKHILKKWMKFNNKQQQCYIACQYSHYVPFKNNVCEWVCCISLSKHICMIYFDFPGPNIARHKQTQQSSVSGDGTSDKGVDGRRENEGAPECVLTYWHNDGAWWRVDLGAEYTVTGVKMYTGTGDCM